MSRNPSIEPYSLVGVGLAEKLELSPLGPLSALGPVGSSSFQGRRTPELVLQKSRASFRITFRLPGADDRGRNRLKGILNRAYE